MYNKSMAKSTTVREKKKSRGRPATGYDPLVAARFPVEMISRVDQWAHAIGISRSEAIRRLVELGLASKGNKTKG